ncbi:MAG: putative secreted protein [Myxococcaceae bacterium]|nr:putative secreted protein [Myxococcaceae bacterium]
MKRVCLSLSLGLLLGAACGKDDSPVGGGGTDVSQNPSTAADGGKDSHADAGALRKDGGGSHAGGGGGGGPIAQTDSGADLCSSRTVNATAVIPDVLIVLDASLSMTIAGRWSPSVMAVQSLTTQYESEVAFGLELFPPGGGPTCDAGKLDAPTMLNNAAAINQIVGSTAAAGLTPTGPALQSALTILGDRTPLIGDSGGGQVTPGNVLLVTDGQPDCGSANPGQDAVDAVTALANASIKTYVVGYQIDGASQGLMNQMAMAGQTDHFYSVESGTALQDAFAQILKNLVSCEFNLDQVPDDPSYVLVTIDGKQVALNADDGWVLDGTNVKLQGGSCDMLKDGTPHSLNVGIECTVVQYL